MTQNIIFFIELFLLSKFYSTHVNIWPNSKWACVGPISYSQPAQTRQTPVPFGRPRREAGGRLARSSPSRPRRPAAATGFHRGGAAPAASPASPAHPPIPDGRAREPAATPLRQIPAGGSQPFWQGGAPTPASSGRPPLRPSPGGIFLPWTDAVPLTPREFLFLSFSTAAL